MMPEDFGGHCVSGPASPWEMEELRSLDGVNEAVRLFFVVSRPLNKNTQLASLQTFLHNMEILIRAGRNFTVLATTCLIMGSSREIVHVFLLILLWQGFLGVFSYLLRRLFFYSGFLGTHPLCHLESLRPSFPQGSGFGRSFVFKFTLAGLFKFLFSFVCGGGRFIRYFWPGLLDRFRILCSGNLPIPLSPTSTSPSFCGRLAVKFSLCPHRVVLACSCRSLRVSVPGLQLLGRLARALVLAEGLEGLWSR